MQVYLYGENFELTEENICEARGKYLVRNSLTNAEKFIKNECKKCRSIAEMMQKIPQITGELILNVTKHMLYILQLEGVSENAQNYINATFQNTGSVCQQFCQMLSEKSAELERAGVEKLNEIPDKLTAAAILDLQNLWRGYFQAHAYSPENEFYTHQQSARAVADIKNLSSNIPMISAIKICVQALQDAPFEDSVYDRTEQFIGADKNLAAYKKLFTATFKPGSYKDMTDPNSLEKLAAEAVKKIDRLLATPEFKFKSYVYSHLDDSQKAEKKFLDARKNYAALAKGETALVCLDATTMGGAEDGALISTSGIYIHNNKESPKFFHFNDIKTLTIDGMVNKMIYLNGQKIYSGGLSNSDVKRFHELINRIRALIAPVHEHAKKRKPGKKDIDDFILSLKNNPQYVFDSNVYFNDGSDKSKKKFKGAISSYARLEVDEYPLICYDGTVFGGASDGFTITSEGIHLKNMSEDKIFFAHDKIRRLCIFKKDIYINQTKVSTLSSDERPRLVDLMQRTRDYFVYF